VARADALEIALAGKAMGAGRDRKDAPIDLAVGVVLEKKIGDPVKAGEVLAVIHARSPQDAEKVMGQVSAAFTLAASARPRSLLLRRVSASSIEPLDA
jgi:pyrimidine-nucleoside phosphorylase